MIEIPSAIVPLSLRDDRSEDSEKHSVELLELMNRLVSQSHILQVDIWLLFVSTWTAYLLQL